MFKAFGRMAMVGTATALVESLLQRLISTGLFDINPAAIAHFVVKTTYEQDPSLFDGKRGPKPHKISFAALSLSQGMRTFEKHSDEYSACHAALGNLLLAMEVGGGEYPLTSKDHRFLEISKNEYLSRENVLSLSTLDDLQPHSLYYDTSDKLENCVEVPSDEELERRKNDLDKRIKAFKR